MMIDEKLRQLIEEVPDYDRFMTVDEMTASSHQLAKTYPGVVEIVPLGHSRNGYPIEALKIGTGSRTGMMVGLPHPNEPIGAMMLETFSKKLAEDADFRAELDTTWYLIKCIDPDGTKLNEGWFSGPFTITNYARHFYRPPGEEQVEWTFPVDYKTYSFNQPLPETQAWMKLIEDCSPDFLYSLHNSGFGGVYLYLSHDIPLLYPPFYDLVNTVELPLHLGEPEAPFVPQFDQAVFGMMGLAAQYDYFSEHSKTDPAEIFKSGANSYEYLTRLGKATFLVCEMPYFYNQSIHDTSPSDSMRRDMALAGLDAQEQIVDFMAGWLDKLELTAESPFRSAISSNIQIIPALFKARRAQIESDPEMERHATVAEKFDNLFVGRFYYVLMLGVFLRMLETEIETSGKTAILEEALAAALQEFEAQTAYLETHMNYTAIPIRKLVQVQLGTAILTLREA